MGPDGDNIGLLVLLPPGNQARHYLLAIHRAAVRLGVHSRLVEVTPLKVQIQQAASAKAAAEGILHSLTMLTRAHRATHVLGYATGGTVDLANAPTPEGMGTVWNALGVRQILLWTDHPNWAVDGAALVPEVRQVLAHPGTLHLLKSQAAAEEARAVLGWPNIDAMPMAEDYELLRPAERGRPVHDVVTIAGSLSRVPEPAERFLNHDDPDPAGIDRAMTVPVLSKWDERVATDATHKPKLRDALRRFAAELLEARAAEPAATIWQITRRLEPDHADAVAWLTSDPQRWYDAEATLRQAAGWRRSFWIAWLARRVNVGVYGCSALELGIDQPRGADQWVAYERQASVYAMGRCALNINQSHDQAGVTHKPFQIAASGVPCVHHATAELADLFTPGREIITFTRGPELLAWIDRLCADPTLGEKIAERALLKARMEHTWEQRLAAVFSQPTESSRSLAA